MTEPAPSSAVETEPGTPDLSERISDRVNPILVREVQQAMNSRAILVALGLSFLAVVLVGLATAAEGPATRRQGWEAFVTTLRVLAPLILLVVPLHAFLSMRQEVSSRTLEHLLLSRLTPAAVARGKLASTAVLALLIFSVFAPLVALTYLLRGVDAPTIAAALALAAVYGIGASMLAVAMGALSRSAAFRALPMVFLALVLALGTAWITILMEPILGGLAFALRREDKGILAVLSAAVPALVSVPLLFLVTTASLAHPFENRSTGFRVFAPVATFGLAAWIAATVEMVFRGLGTGISATAIPAMLETWALVTLPFWLFAATEPDRLSPRVRAHVPRNPVLAALSIPFLPGSSRGFLWTALFALLAIGLASWIPSWFGVAANDGAARRVVAAWCYVVVGAGLARGGRRLLPADARGTVIARVAFPAALAVVVALPTVARLVAGSTRHRSPLDVLNPFVTVSMAGQDAGLVGLVVVGAAAAFALAVGLPAMARGAHEVLQASRDRRRRAS